MPDEGEGRERRPPPAGREAFRALGDPRARPNVDWVAALASRGADDLRGPLAELDGLAELDREIRRRQRAAGRRSFAQFRAPFDLYLLVRLLRPDHVVETGVSSGVSSAHFLAALRKNGRGVLHSIDQPTAQAGERFGPRDSPVALPRGHRTGWVVPEDLRAGWDLRIGPSQRLLPELVADLPSLGMFLHDSYHTPGHLAFELETVRPKLRTGAVLLADNTQWTGKAFDRFAARHSVPVLRRGRSDLVGCRFPG